LVSINSTSPKRSDKIDVGMKSFLERGFPLIPLLRREATHRHLGTAEEAAQRFH